MLTLSPSTVYASVHLKDKINFLQNLQSFTFRKIHQKYRWHYFLLKGKCKYLVK